MTGRRAVKCHLQGMAQVYTRKELSTFGHGWRRGCRAHPSLLAYLLLIDSGREKSADFHCTASGDATGLHWTFLPNGHTNGMLTLEESQNKIMS